MQSDILKYAIHTIKETLSSNAENTFTVVDAFTTESDDCQVKVDVKDIFQTANDKTGQKIIVDEKIYEVPAQFEMLVSIEFMGNNLEEKLAAVGLVAVILKDNSVFECNDYNWHGNELNKIFIEPIVRKSVQINEKLHLDYRIEIQINSRKGVDFKRVEKKDLRSNQMKN